MGFFVSLKPLVLFGDSNMMTPPDQQRLNLGWALLPKPDCPGDISLDYPGGSSVITRVFRSGRSRKKRGLGRRQHGEGRADTAGSEDGEGPGPQEGRRPGEAAHDEGTLPPRAETILPSP